MSAVVDSRGISALAYVVGSIRPQWDAPGIRSALERALGQHPYPDVAIVAVSSARDPKAATPGVIPTRCANGWMANTTDEVKPRTPLPDSPADMTCNRCGLWVVRGEQHECARRADPDTVHAMAAAAKAAIAQPPPERQPDRDVNDVELPEEDR